MSKMKQEILDQVKVLKAVYYNYANGISDISNKLLDKNIFLIGTGASLNACYQAKYAFLKYMNKSVTVVAGYEIDYYANLFDENSAVLIVSQSGESYETKVVVDRLKERKVAFYGITNEPTSYLARNSSFAFLCNAGVEVSSGTKTHTATIMIFYMLASMGNENVLVQIEKIPQRVKETIEEVTIYLNEICNFLSDTSILYVVGKNTHCPTAQQASLLLKEKIFVHAEGLALSEFRHGPVEAVKKDTKIIILSSGKENFENSLEHAEFLKKVCGANIVMISDQEGESINGFRNFNFKWNMDEQLSHICATIPFQLIVENIANLKSYDVDGFKYINKVLNQY